MNPAAGIRRTVTIFSLFEPPRRATATPARAEHPHTWGDERSKSLRLVGLPVQSV
jgi:hypothetical protein